MRFQSGRTPQETKAGAQGNEDQPATTATSRGAIRGHDSCTGAENAQTIVWLISNKAQTLSKRPLREFTFRKGSVENYKRTEEDHRTHGARKKTTQTTKTSAQTARQHHANAPTTHAATPTHHIRNNSKRTPSKNHTPWTNWTNTKTRSSSTQREKHTASHTRCKNKHRSNKTTAGDTASHTP